MLCFPQHFHSDSDICTCLYLGEKRHEYNMQSEKITQKEDRNALICYGVTGKQEMRIPISAALLESLDVAPVNYSKCM